MNNRKALLDRLYALDENGLRCCPLCAQKGKLAFDPSEWGNKYAELVVCTSKDCWFSTTPISLDNWNTRASDELLREQDRLLEVLTEHSLESQTRLYERIDQLEAKVGVAKEAFEEISKDKVFDLTVGEVTSEAAKVASEALKELKDK